MAASAAVLRSRVLARAVSAVLRGSLDASTQPRSLLSAASRRASSVHRSPLVCAGFLSVMPLHSAVASARLRSAISPESQSWGLVPQVASMVQMRMGISIFITCAVFAPGYTSLLKCWEFDAFMTAYFLGIHYKVAFGSEAFGG